MDSNLVLIYTSKDKVIKCDNPQCDWFGTAGKLNAEKIDGFSGRLCLRCPKCGSRLGLDVITRGE